MNKPEPKWTWTPDKVRYVERLAAEGVSSGKIAKDLGITRNAVIGLCGRRKIKLISQHRVDKKPPSIEDEAPAGRPSRERPKPSAPKTLADAKPIAAAFVEPKLTAAPPPPAPPGASEFEDWEETVGREPRGAVLAVLAVSDKVCRWPVGDPARPDFHFCSNPVAPLVPYCRYHMRLAYTPSAPRKR